MRAMLEVEPERRVAAERAVILAILASDQPDAKTWEASIRNNLGCALNEAGRYEEALGEFQAAQRLRERAGEFERTRVARWMVAHILRLLGRFEEALGIQRDLARVGRERNIDDPYVTEELNLLAQSPPL